MRRLFTVWLAGTILRWAIIRITYNLIYCECINYKYLHSKVVKKTFEEPKLPNAMTSVADSQEPIRARANFNWLLIGRKVLS